MERTQCCVAAGRVADHAGQNVGALLVGSDLDAFVHPRMQRELDWGGGRGCPGSHHLIVKARRVLARRPSVAGGREGRMAYDTDLPPDPPLR